MSGVLELLYVNPWQWRRLFTHEDAHYAHAHKILGVAVLGHFAYRGWLFCQYGDMMLNASWITFFWILVHGLLHVTSFQFIIPSRRNKTYNIIWPEMRFHTMIFAYRSLVTMLVMWLNMGGYISEVTSHMLRPMIVLGTMAVADYTTYYYKHVEEKVAKDDSTMRGNPYPSYVPEWYIKVHNYFYSISQAFATLHILNSRNIDPVFLLLLPIQTAPFCMTLVKKGILKQGGWHLYYTLALAVNFIYAIWHTDAHKIFAYSSPLVLFFVVGRFKYNCNKYVLWSMVAGCIYSGYLVKSDLNI